ncbi:MAG: alpha/beta hydrolase [Pseudolysinimonas sp.]
MIPVTSKDGTTIATYREGSGPLIVLVDAALSLHDQSAKLSSALAPAFTAVSYDRRGRGASGETLPPLLDREVEDIEAIVAANGGHAILFGSSSGGALALEAASRLGDAVTGLFLYEPPFIVDDSRPPLPADLPTRIAALVRDRKRGKAVSAFFREAMGIPAPFVALMHLMPSWGQGVRVAHTLAYDFAVLEGTQDGMPLPTQRWAGMRAPGIVMVGSRSEPFFHTGAQALAALLPSIEYVSLEGGHHGSAVMSPAGIADAITRRFVAS